MNKKPREADYGDTMILQIANEHNIKKEVKAIKKLLSVGAKDKVWHPEARVHQPDDFHENLSQAWGDLTGAELDAKEVRAARMTEIGYARRKNVWTKIRRSEAVRRGWKIIKTKWIDINKGDAKNPMYRSRFVGKEFNNGDADGLFAGTPPLEALRLILSRTATGNQDMNYKTIMINDVSRAFFEAPMQKDRNLCIELPWEDMTEKDRENDMVGYLSQSLYGTRDAAANFQKEVMKFMIKCGFRQGRYNPCTYYHKGRHMITLVHGDDFVTAGYRSDCERMKMQLEKRFEIKTKLVGMMSDEAKEERILNRVIRVNAHGWEMEADQRHADILIEQMNLKNAKGVSSPGEEEKRWEEEENSVLLEGAEAKRHRELAARAKYLAQDRIDIQFATKEICRGMCTPCKGDVKKLRRLARYLITVPRMVMNYYWQQDGRQMAGYTDSDFAGCRTAAKSTSGGVLTIGSHYIKSWSSTQKTIALSSGEAELTAVVKCSCETIGVIQLAQDWGIDLEGDIMVDSSAALGVVSRKGAGRLRHVRVGKLWVQEVQDNGDLRYRKAKGTDNPADMITKYLTHGEIQRYLDMIGIDTREGRADRSLEIAF